jgi:hypothetical protein
VSIFSESGNSREAIMSTLRKLVISGAAVMLGLSASAFADDPSAAPSQEPGVWQKHQYSFQFLGFTTTYSCDGLASKLKVLLIAAGARTDAKATSGACAQGFGRPDKFARADLTFYTLATADKGNADAIVSGDWRAVVFLDRRPRELALGDCELVEQFRDAVLPMFTTRNVDTRTTCVPNQLSGSVINLRFEAFSAVPAAKK